MLLASAEGTAFEIAKGRYSETANFEVFLKGHSGDPLRVGRISRDSEAINYPSLSAALAVQPDVMSGLAEQASMRGRGFLARWLYSLPTSKVGKRKIAAAPMPERVRADYRAGMIALWGVPEPDPSDSEPGWKVPFSQGADESLRELERWLEPQLADGEPMSYLAGWASKLAGAVARLSVGLHMAATLATDSPWMGEISRETVEAAITLSRDYFLPHAQAAFGAMGANENAKDAARVVGWLTGLDCETVKVWKGVPIVTKADIHRKSFGGSRSVEEVRAVCRLLCEHGYLRSVGPAWRRDVQAFEPNPACQEPAENT